MTVENMEANLGEDGETPVSFRAKKTRRPMNSYFIFCKKYRKIVKQRHPTAENRLISKYLGEWWSSLTDEKKQYAELAKKLKDRFFEINPDFQWYQPPTPTPRSELRPQSSLSSYADTEEWNQSNDDHTNNNRIDKINCNVEPSKDDTPTFTPGKLADEANMGGLNSLMMLDDHNKKSDSSQEAQKYNAETKPTNLKLKELQDELSATSKAFETLEDSCEKENTTFVSRKRLHSNMSLENENGDSLLPTRSCKGKRYEEFKSDWGVHKRQRQERHCSLRKQSTQSRRDSESSVDSIESRNEINNTQIDYDNGSPEELTAFTLADLIQELAALPPLDYDAYLIKKKENLNRKKQTPLARAIERRNKLRERARAKIVGSGKRKQKKDSITRLEMNSQIEPPSNHYPQHCASENNKITDLDLLAEIASIASKITTPDQNAVVSTEMRSDM